MTVFAWPYHTRTGADSAPDDQSIALRDADGVLEHELIEFGGHSTEIEVREAAAHAVCPDFLQGRHNGPDVRPLIQEALHMSSNVSGSQVQPPGFPIGQASSGIRAQAPVISYQYPCTLLSKRHNQVARPLDPVPALCLTSQWRSSSPHRALQAGLTTPQDAPG